MLVAPAELRVSPAPAGVAVLTAAGPVVPGPILFARYAFGPNRLGYCGPPDAAGLFERAASGLDLAGIRELAMGFEGAWPYLSLIAERNGIADPLDRRVVEAYWVGNSLLDRVGPGALGEHLRTRFRGRLRPGEWRWLETKAPDGARPHHAFHVLEVFPRVGLLRGGDVGRVLEIIESCRVRWGRVRAIDGSRLTVDVVPLRMLEGRLAFGPPEPLVTEAWHAGAGFLGEVAVGDVVAVHWGWACDRLTPDQARKLAAWTRHHVRLANATL